MIPSWDVSDSSTKSSVAAKEVVLALIRRGMQMPPPPAKTIQMVYLLKG